MFRSRPQLLNRKITWLYLAFAILLGVAGATVVFSGDLLKGGTEPSSPDPDLIFDKKVSVESIDPAPRIELQRSGQSLEVAVNTAAKESIRLDINVINRTSSELTGDLEISTSANDLRVDVSALIPTDVSALTRTSVTTWRIRVKPQESTRSTRPDLRLQVQASASSQRPLKVNALLSSPQAAAQESATATPEGNGEAESEKQEDSQSDVSSTGSQSQATPTAAAGNSAGGETDLAVGRFPGYDWGHLEGKTATDASAITLINTSFLPQMWKVSAGTKVTFVNRDSAAHTVTIPGLDVDTTLNKGGTLTVSFPKQGVYSLVCTIHPPNMLARAVVVK